MTIQSVIGRKRDGLPHSREEIEFLVRGAVDGSLEDYQLAAWLMAAYVHPLSPEETAWLTLAMAGSGERLDLKGLSKPWVDKHSTGGVGDKTTIVLLPLLAACGLTVVKMSGRGLGITGGTIDKLGSVPGFRLDLSPEEMKEQARRIGLALTGQTPNLAPADKVLYALRDATATVESIPLIVSSILSKKIAGGAETIVLDVKCGSGAFMKTEAEARELAMALKRTAELAGVEVRLALTDMDQPLGRAVGNALEVAEALETLRGKQGRFYRLCVEPAGSTLWACGLAPSHEDGKLRAEQALTSGDALQKAAGWFAAQGFEGDLSNIGLPVAPLQKKVFHAGEGGWAGRVDAQTVGETVVALGGGRARKEDEIDPSVGVEVFVSIGDRVEHSQILFTVHARTEAEADAAASRLLTGVQIVPAQVQAQTLVLDIV